jgi:alpha-L-rhamnosidase
LNGGKVGKDYLTPGWTDYHHRIQYQAYDVTGQLSQGVNTMGALLGNGWWSSDMGWPDPNKGLEWYNKDTLCFLAELHVTYEDGTKEKIFTDSGWKFDYSPVIENTLLHGERYDARLEQEGWDTAGFNDEDWQPCEIFEMQFDHVVSQQQPPIKVIEILSPEKELKLDDGAIIYDFGKQITGFANIETRGEPGTQISIRFVEKLKDGMIYNENLRTARQTDTYILKGRGTEEWQPRFTYHGFRYAEVRFDPAPPDSFQITGVALRSSFDRTGAFECSNQLINQIHQNAVNTMNCVSLGYPSDNNSRDERLGWTYDAQINTPALNYNFNALNFMRKYLKDMKDGRHKEGYVVPVAPRIIHHEREFPGWSDAIIIIPYHLYLMYGDERIITENYDAMRKWLDISIKTQHVDDRRSSDHNPLSQKYAKFGTAIFINCLDYFVELAQVIGKKEDAEFYHNKANELKEHFNHRYFNQDENTYNPDIQFAYATALAWDIYPEGRREQVAENLIERVQLADWHVTTGFLGTRFLFQALSENGYHDDAYRILTQTSYPSYGYMVKKGATSIWERWNSDTAKPGMNTMSHVGFASIDQWFYAYLAGIRAKIEYPGFKQFIIDPKPVEGLDYVKASLETAYGTIISSWNTSSSFQLKVSIPPNTRADVTIPGGKGKQIQINRKPLFDGEKLADNDFGISLIRTNDHETLLQVGSGTFVFDSKWK